MNLSDITTRGWILALFIRDDGERFLLGDGWYDFKDGLQHFQPNTIASDIVELQGTDGQLLAGQVRRSTAQRFNGYIGDSTITKIEIEARRMAFLQFFQVRRSYDVIYIFPDGSSIKRERGYLVEAPSVPEMWQFYPEYSVALNFENVNYYEYAEDDSGQEIFAHSVLVAISNSLKGGLIWDGNGAYSEALNWSGYQSATGDYITLNDAIEDAPLTLTQLSGNAEQTTYSGKNLLPYPYVDSTVTRYGITYTVNADQSITVNGTATTASYFILQRNGAYGDANINGAGNGTNGSYSVPVTSASAPFMFYGSSDGTLSINVYSGVTISNYTFRPMVVAGTTAGSYEPYVGGTASPNPDYPQAVETVTGEQMIDVRGGKNLFKVNRTPGEPSDTTYTGTTKRLFNYDEYVVGLSNTNYLNPGVVTCSVAGGVVTVMTTMGGYGVGFAVKVFPSTDYVMSFDVTNATQSVIGLAFYEADGSFISQSILNNSTRTFTTPANCNHIAIVFRPNANQECAYSNIQLEYGNSASSFEPYQGQSFYVDLHEPNLFDISKVITNGTDVVNNNDGTLTVRGYGKGGASPNKLSDYCPTLQAGDTVILDATTTSTNKLIYLAQGSNVSWNFGTSRTITATDLNSVVLWYAYYGNTDPATISNIKIRKPIELAKIPDTSYQGRIYPSDGKWYIEKQVGKVVLDGSESWGTLGSSGYTFRKAQEDALLNGAGGTIAPIISDNYTPATYYATYDGTVDYGIALAPNSGRIAITNKDITTVADFRTWLASHPTTVYYALATPTTTEITDETLLAQLNFIANLYGGVNHISLVPSSGAQGTMTVQYATELLPGGGYVWEEGDTGGVTNVNVIGVANAQPIWTVTGPAVDPTLTNITTGQAITWTGTVPNNQTLVVDMGKQTAELNGANVYSGISGDWIDLQIGQNKLTYSAIGGEIPPSKIEWNGVVG